MLHHQPPLNAVFQALADPTRRSIVDRLSRGPATISALAQPLSITLSAVIQHVQILEASGVVRSQKVGRVRTCRIDGAALRSAESWIADRRASLERRFDRLGHYLAEHPDKPPTME